MVSQPTALRYRYVSSRYHIEADGDLVCQSGVGWEQVNETLKEEGIPLFFPVSFLTNIHVSSLNFV